MKKILFCLALITTMFVGSSAYAQELPKPAPLTQVKGGFLTFKMMETLSLSTEQVQQLAPVNARRYSVIANVGSDPEFLALSDTEKADKKAHGELKFDAAVKKVLTDAQYALYLTEKINMLQAVIDAFGE